MKTILFSILAFAVISCNKSNTMQSVQPSPLPLKAIPTAIADGKTITLTADKSTGDITAYGWQLEESSPTQSPITYVPRSSHTGSDFIPIKAIVNKVGTYVFRLTVYHEKESDYAFVNVEVK